MALAGFAAALATGFAAGFTGAFAVVFAVGLAGAFFSALRAAGAAFLAGADGFDFAAVFLDFATALAMAPDNPKEEWELRALHHFDGFRASRETPFGG
jgi:ABC-type transport system involved in cytochrome bd biosynthesis fused ATPase/permease subunit